MPEPVKLYVYDLSNGLAKQMSLQLTGRQIDGIWHTSIVVFGKEIFYGQGINITAPGRSHHGSPLQIVNLGETAIDEQTFNEYIEEMKDHYSADKYHLLDFNCNSFTNDCAGFLTGNSIPDYIKDLPSDFLNTPFGAALRPTIDSMYRRPTPGTTPARVSTPSPAASTTPNPELAASILQAVAAQAQQGMVSSSSNSSMPSTEPTDSLAAPLHPCTNSASFKSLLRTHKAVIACFSDVVTCPPCRMIAPIYEQLAREKGIKTGGGGGAAFTKIDLSVSAGQVLGEEWGVRVVPTFMLFLNGEKISEMKGADERELRTQIDLLLFQAYPPHPHTSLSLPAMQALSLKPILFTQVPALDSVATKLSSFVGSTTWSSGLQTQAEVKQGITTSFLPYLKSRNAPATVDAKTALPSANPTSLMTWAQITATLSQTLPLESLFPLVDMWRLALLDPAVSTWCASITSSSNNPIQHFLTKAVNAGQSAPRPFLLTLLRLLSNAFSGAVLAPRLLIGSWKKDTTAVLVPALLHEDAAVRTAASSLTFNLSAYLQTGRVDAVRNSRGGTKNDFEDEDWELEMVSAIIEALDREKANEDIVHRLSASLGSLLRLSPFYESQLSPLLEVLQAKSILRGKLEKGGCGPNGVTKKDVSRLVGEIAEKLCP